MKKNIISTFERKMKNSKFKKAFEQLEKKLQTKDKRLYKTYGIHLSDWNKTINKQNWICAICKEEMTKEGKPKVLCQDHQHVKGFKKMSPEEKRQYLRGGLCFLCNTAIKWERSGKGRQMLEGMVEYFNKYKFKGEK